MERSNIADTGPWFRVLQTGATTQVAVMDLAPGGGESGERGSEHAASEQVLFVVDGQVDALIGDEKATLQAGDVVIVPRGVLHRFSNPRKTRARTLNVYSPPAY